MRPASLTSRVPSGPSVTLRGWLSPEATTWKAGGPAASGTSVAAAVPRVPGTVFADAVAAGLAATRVTTKAVATAIGRQAPAGAAEAVTPYGNLVVRWERRLSEWRGLGTLTSNLVVLRAVGCVNLPPAKMGAGPWDDFDRKPLPSKGCLPHSRGMPIPPWRSLLARTQDRMVKSSGPGANY